MIPVPTNRPVRRKRLPRNVRAAYRAPYGSWSERIATLRFLEAELGRELTPQRRDLDAVPSGVRATTGRVEVGADQDRYPRVRQRADARFCQQLGHATPSGRAVVREQVEDREQ